jgi:hypothetical protein
MTALDSGRPMVSATVLVRYMKEMAGARCDGWAMTAWRETKTADWAVPVPKPLVDGEHVVNITSLIL